MFQKDKSNLRIQVVRNNFEHDILSRRCSSFFSPQNVTLTLIYGKLPNIRFDGLKDVHEFCCGYRLIFHFHETDIDSPAFDELSKLSGREQINKFCSQNNYVSKWKETFVANCPRWHRLLTTTKKKAHSPEENRLNDSLFDDHDGDDDENQSIVNFITRIVKRLLEVTAVTKPIKELSFFFPHTFDMFHHHEMLFGLFLENDLKMKHVFIDTRGKPNEILNRTDFKDNIVTCEIFPIKTEGKKHEIEGCIRHESNKSKKSSSSSSSSQNQQHLVLLDFPNQHKCSHLISPNKFSVIDVLTFFREVEGGFSPEMLNRETAGDIRQDPSIDSFQTDCGFNFLSLADSLCCFLSVRLDNAFQLLDTKKHFQEMH